MRRLIPSSGPVGRPPASSSERTILRYAYATTMVAISAVSLLAPSIPELAATYGVTVSEVAWIQIGVLLPGIVSASGLLWLAASRGLTRVLSASLLVYGVAGAANYWHDVFSLVVALRVIQGVGAGALLAGSFALIARLPRELRHRGISRNAALVSLMMLLQPLLGAALARVSPLTPFLFYLVALPLAVAVARLPNTRTTQQPISSIPQGGGRGLTAALLATVFLNAIVFGWLLYLAPILLADRFDLGVVPRGIVLSLQSGAAAVIALMSRRVLSAGREAALVVGSGALVIVTLPVVALADHLVVVIIGLAAAGAAYGLANPAVISLITVHAPEAASGWWQSAARVGQVLGPLGAALLLADISLTTTTLLGAFLGLGILLTAPGLRRPATGPP